MRPWAEVSFMLGNGYERAFLATVYCKMLEFNVIKQATDVLLRECAHLRYSSLFLGKHFQPPQGTDRPSIPPLAPPPT